VGGGKSVRTVPDVARCLQSAANAEQSATRSRDCGVYLLLHLSARRACAEMRCRYAAPAHWCSAANCETFRIPALMSKRTILIPNEAGWTRGRGLSLRRCDCVAFEQIYGLQISSWSIFLLPSLNCMQFCFRLISKFVDIFFILLFFIFKQQRATRPLTSCIQDTIIWQCKRVTLKKLMKTEILKFT